MKSSNKNSPGQSERVDAGLVAMFLRMTPEERIMANDNSLRAIWELKDAFTQQEKQTVNRRLGRTA